MLSSHCNASSASAGCLEVTLENSSPRRCDPAKKALVSTNGRSTPPDLWIKPSAVAICCWSWRNRKKENMVLKFNEFRPEVSAEMEIFMLH